MSSLYSSGPITGQHKILCTFQGRVQMESFNLINHLLQTLKFNDTFGEPDGIHSIDCVWRYSYCCFECWKRLLYFFLTILYGIWLSIWWGCEFAYIAFFHIWIISPCMKIMKINCGLCQRIHASCINCCIAPCCASCGAIFSAFKE